MSRARRGDLWSPAVPRRCPSAPVGAAISRPPICARRLASPSGGSPQCAHWGIGGPLPSRRLRETRIGSLFEGAAPVRTLGLRESKPRTSPCGGRKIVAFCPYNVSGVQKVSKNADPSSLFWKDLRFLSRIVRGISEILRRAARYFAISRNAAAFPASAARTEVLTPVQGRGLPSTRVTCPPASLTMRAPAA